MRNSVDKAEETEHCNLVQGPITVVGTLQNVSRLSVKDYSSISPRAGLSFYLLLKKMSKQVQSNLKYEGGLATLSNQTKLKFIIKQNWYFSPGLFSTLFKLVYFGVENDGVVFGKKCTTFKGSIQKIKVLGGLQMFKMEGGGFKKSQNTIETRRISIGESFEYIVSWSEIGDKVLNKHINVICVSVSGKTGFLNFVEKEYSEITFDSGDIESCGVHIYQGITLPKNNVSSGGHGAMEFVTAMGNVSDGVYLHHLAARYSLSNDMDKSYSMINSPIWGKFVHTLKTDFYDKYRSDINIDLVVLETGDNFNKIPGANSLVAYGYARNGDRYSFPPLRYNSIMAKDRIKIILGNSYSMLKQKNYSFHQFLTFTNKSVKKRLIFKPHYDIFEKNLIQPKLEVIVVKCGLGAGRCDKECAHTTIEEHIECGWVCAMHREKYESATHRFRQEVCECRDYAAKQGCLDQGRSWSDQTCSCSFPVDHTCTEGNRYDSINCLCTVEQNDATEDSLSGDIHEDIIAENVVSREIINIILLLVKNICLVAIVISLCTRLMVLRKVLTKVTLACDDDDYCEIYSTANKKNDALKPSKLGNNTYSKFDIYSASSGFGRDSIYLNFKSNFQSWAKIAFFMFFVTLFIYLLHILIVPKICRHHIALFVYLLQKFSTKGHKIKFNKQGLSCAKPKQKLKVGGAIFPQTVEGGSYPSCFILKIDEHTEDYGLIIAKNPTSEFFLGGS